MNQERTRETQSTSRRSHRSRRDLGARSARTVVGQELGVSRPWCAKPEELCQGPETTGPKVGTASCQRPLEWFDPDGLICSPRPG